MTVEPKDVNEYLKIVPATVAAGSALGTVFSRFLGRSAASAAVEESVLAAIKARRPLTEAELGYIGPRIKPAELRMLRERQIALLTAEEAQRNLQYAPLLLPAHTDEATEPEAQPSKPPSSEEFFSKYWDDAGLAAELGLQALYARILLREVAAPGSCSLKTLRTLRYLDRSDAELFARCVPLALLRLEGDGGWIPHERRLWKRSGLEMADILSLDEAGLIQLAPGTALPGDDYYEWGSKGLYMTGEQSVPVHALTRAGCELARVAQVDRDPEYFVALTRYLTSRGFQKVHQANIPAGWNRSPRLLDWSEVPSASPTIPDENWPWP